jgi:hypothetical protein
MKIGLFAGAESLSPLSCSMTVDPTRRSANERDLGRRGDQSR